MRNQRIRLLDAVLTLGAASVVPLALATPAGAAVPGQIVITEWMYNPTSGAFSEFVEVTNIGEPVDMAGYSFDDDSRVSGTFSLAGLSSLAPGESGLIIETPAAAFRTDWGLDAAVKIAAGNTANLGRNDEINIFDGTSLADRLTYGDQTFSTPATLRTVGKSGVPTTCLALGANDVGAWVFSAVGDGRGSKYAFALEAGGTAHRVAVVDTAMGHVMDVQFDTDLQRIWTLCDNTCSVSSTLLKVDATGTIVPDVVSARPASLPNVNIEGFAIAPDSTCVDGLKEVIWSDDGIAAIGHEGHALYSGTFPCGLDLGEQGAPAAADLGARGGDAVSIAKKGTLAVHGSGFEPGETVRIELHWNQVDVLTSVVADEFGLAIAEVTIPAGVQPGLQEIWLVAPSTTATAGLSITTPATHP